MPLPAPHLRLVQAAVKMANAPELSLRGGQRPTWRPEREARGSALGVQSREGSSVFAGVSLLSGRILRDSHVASLLGMTNLRASRHRMRIADIANERRYRRNRLVRFYRHLVRTGSAFPRLPRRFAPRNDNSGAIIILMSACSVRRCGAGRGMPRPYNAQPETFRFYSPRLALFFSPEIWYHGRRRCSAWRMCLTILTGAAI